MIKIRFTLLGLCMLLLTVKGWAQGTGTVNANPAVTAAIISPTTPLNAVNDPFSMTFTIGTSSSSAAAQPLDGSNLARRMGFSICLGKATWATGDALTSISGDLLTKFDVNLNAQTGCLDGRQKQGLALAPTDLSDIVIQARVTQLSSSTVLNDIGASCNIAPAAASNGFNSTADDFKSIYTRTTAVLPVSLISFSAEAQSNRTVLVKWVTSWEKANKGYVIERSKDLKSFENIGQVNDVAGNTNSKSSYQFEDRNPYRGTSYYRLRQLDLNGGSETFDAKSVIIDGRYGVFPNPVASHNFTLELDEPTTAVLHFYSASGSEISVSKSEPTELSTKVTPSANLTSGVYILTVEERGTTRKHRLVVQ